MTKKENLEKSIRYEYSKPIVKDLFKDFEEEFKRLRNPTNSQIEEYRQALIDYSNYMYFDRSKK
jgi:hypothetical protein